VGRADEGRQDQVRPTELEALTTVGVRAFCLTNANLRGSEMAQRFVDQLPKITRIATEQRGPYIYGVYADGVRALWPK